MYIGDHASAVAAGAELGREFAVTAAGYDRSAAFPFANFEKLRAAGLLCLATARRFGGQGTGLVQSLAVVNAISRGEPSTGLILAQQYLFHAGLRSNANWPERLREAISVSAVTEGGLANMLRVEPELGTPVRGGIPATIARKVDGGWSLSGHKIFATGSHGLTWNAVWARTDEADLRVGQVIVPLGAKGFRIVDSWDHLGMRASSSHDVVLEDVFVPDDHAVDLRRPADWAARDPAAVAWTALLFACIYDGVARAARDWLIGFLKTRVPSNLGAPLATLGRMQDAVGQIEALLQTNTQLFALAEKVDQGHPPPPHEAYLAKYTINANAITAVEKAVEVSGNPGLTRANPLERHLRDVLCARVHSPQADMVLGNAGRIALGLAEV